MPKHDTPALTVLALLCPLIICCTDGPPGYTMAAGRIPMVSACATVINWPWTKSRETNPLATRCRDWNCCRQLCDANANCNAFAFGFQRVDLLPQDLCHWTGNDCCFTFSLSGSCQSSSTWMLNNYDTYTRMTGKVGVEMCGFEHLAQLG